MINTHLVFMGYKNVTREGVGHKGDEVVTL